MYSRKDGTGTMGAYTGETTKTRCNPAARYTLDQNDLKDHYFVRRYNPI